MEEINPKYQRTRAAERRAASKHRAKKRTFVQAWKAERGCRDCGNSDARVLDLHHTDPTTKHPLVGRFTVNRLSWSDLELELDKCIVLCANCHRIEEWNLRR